MTIKTDEMEIDRSTWVITNCPWCNSDKAIMEDPELPDSSRFIHGQCPTCERAFEFDQYEDYFEDAEEG
jgi:hypothetical protein